ncbi:haloacid dehalogenase type II, partial [Pseudomonas syringae]
MNVGNAHNHTMDAGISTQRTHNDVHKEQQQMKGYKFRRIALSNGAMGSLQQQLEFTG